jgi:hypothetical protein
VQWNLVLDDLFLENKPLSMFKKAAHAYAFRKKGNLRNEVEIP